MRTAIIFRFFFLLCQKRDVRGVRKEDKVLVMEKIDILRLLQFSCLIDNYLCTFLWIRNIFVTTHSIHLSFFHQHLSKKCVQQNVTRKTKWYLLQFHESEEQVDNLTTVLKRRKWQQTTIVYKSNQNHSLIMRDELILMICAELPGYERWS